MVFEGKFKAFSIHQMFSIFEKHIIRKNLVLNIFSVISFCDFYGLKRPNKRAMMALGRSTEYDWNQIISKSVHRFSRRSRLKPFSIYSPGGHFVQQSGTV